MVETLLKNFYGLSPCHIKKSSIGAGSDTYFITSKAGKYVLKFPCESEMNNPEAEPQLCDFLLKKGLPVSEFVPNKFNSCISSDDSGRKFHLQKFAEGRLYGLNEAPDWLLTASAQMLGTIHRALQGYQGLPEGIGKSFFEHMTPAAALHSYIETQKIAQQHGDKEIAADLAYRIALMPRFPDIHIDLARLSCQSTHGDYFISQLICGENEINAVIDWTTACVHPIIWEILRSFVYAARDCINGEICIPAFVAYVSEYLAYGRLNDYDIEMMAPLFFYQISVCDYYRQYYESTAENRSIYLHQAVFSTKLMKWFEYNLCSLTEALQNRFSPAGTAT